MPSKNSSLETVPVLRRWLSPPSTQPIKPVLTITGRRVPSEAPLLFYSGHSCCGVLFTDLPLRASLPGWQGSLSNYEFILLFTVKSWLNQYHNPKCSSFVTLMVLCRIWLHTSPCGWLGARAQVAVLSC